MSKTDKELTVEIVNNFITSWNNRPTTTTFQGPELEKLIQDVYAIIQSLPEEKK